VCLGCGCILASVRACIEEGNRSPAPSSSLPCGISGNVILSANVDSHYCSHIILVCFTYSCVAILSVTDIVLSLDLESPPTRSEILLTVSLLLLLQLVML
jgi:hypothetical protein